MRKNNFLSLLSFSFFLLNSVLKIPYVEGDNAEIAFENQGEAEPPKELTISFNVPVDDQRLADINTVVDMTKFQTCQIQECFRICGSENKNFTYCDQKNTKLCMCSPEIFQAANAQGSIHSVNRFNKEQKNCSIACNKRFSYGRIWTESDNKTMHCLCLMNKITKTGITLCDPAAAADVCKALCQTDSAICAFNGVCLCRSNWEPFFNLSVANTRKEQPSDLNECSVQCSSYHHDYVGRIYDFSLANAASSSNIGYKFREKYCLCGPWMDLFQYPQTKAVIDQGFQLCTGLKCKQRCGMDEAICEPIFRRGCLCQRENIQIDKHLWSRLPTHQETTCYRTCSASGFDARVIEWNPFMNPTAQKLYDPFYRKTTFQYLYDGKFCHCIKSQRDMHQYRPCTDELCRQLCEHDKAECDKRTRRACFCNTHQMMRGLGRLPDPGEINCDIACRYGLFDARILEVTWDIQPDLWATKNNKYCGCIRLVSIAGLSHCDVFNDECPKYCGTPQAFCTRQKYCHCGIVPPNFLESNNLVRLGNGKEQDECGEKCRSWLWPMTEDTNNKPFIYDEALINCIETDSCPQVDTSPWHPNKAGSITAQDTLEIKLEKRKRRFCLCAKTSPVSDIPGTRLQVNIEPQRLPNTQPCIGNHTCIVQGNSLHIIA